MLEDLRSLSTPYVEVKSENKIDRSTGVAKDPRLTERLPAGAELEFEFVYNLYDQTEAIEDLQNLEAALRFVEDEYLGGSGSRGYGRVVFEVKSLEWKTRDSYLGIGESAQKDITGSGWLNEAAKLIGLNALARQ
jgi:CRISPR-associated protein Csm3